MVTPLPVGPARRAIEGMYTGRCDVIIQKSEKNPKTKLTEQQEIQLHESIPCHLSYKTIVPAGDANPAAPVAQTVKLFLAPEVEIPPGSKLVVTQAGITAEYSRSGQPAVYPTHQEISLELFPGWA